MSDIGILDSVLNNFTSAAGVWGPQLFYYLQPVFLAIVVLQFGLVAAEATVERDVPLLISHTMIGLLRIGVIWSIFTYSSTCPTASCRPARRSAATSRALGSRPAAYSTTASA